MTTSRLSRRAVIGSLLSASLIGTGLLAFAAEAPCMTFTDPKGDSRPSHIPTSPSQLAEDGLDLTGVTFESPGADLQVALHVVNLNVAPEYSLGDAYYARFKHGGKAVELYAFRYSPTEIGDVLALDAPQSGMKVAGKAVASKLKMTYDEKLEKVVFTVPVADLEKATATPAAGSALTELTAEAAGDNVLTADAWDTATAPKDMTHAIGSACGGGAAPAPAPVVPSSAPSPAPSAPPAPPAGAPAAAGLPTADCFLTKDPKGDARPLNANVPNDPDLDLTGLVMQTTGTSLVAYAKVDKLAAGPSQSTDGHRFTFYFTHNKNVFAMAGSAYKNPVHGQIRDGAASTGQFSKVTQLSVNGLPLTDPNSRTSTGFVESGLKFTFDQKNSYVIATLPVADVEKYGKAPLAGATLSGVYVTSATDTDLVASQADAAPDGATASAPGKITYTAGDNACFAPATPPLSSVGAVKAQFGDTAAVAAKLVDAGGAPVAGKDVTFTLGTSTATGKTGADGIAKALLLVKEKAGSRTLTIAAEGTTVTTPFTVLVEKTVLKAAAAKGNVTATLTDDDRKPVAGQTITFTSGSKKVTTKTNASGIAKAGFAPGSAVTVTYAGLADQYSASKASAKA